MATHPQQQFVPSDEQEAIRAAVREFGERECIRPGAREHDESHEYPWDVIKKATKLDLVGPMILTEYGGAGMDVLETTIFRGVLVG